MVDGKWCMRGLWLVSVFAMAGCLGTPSGGGDVTEGPDRIIDPGELDPTVPEEEVPIDIIADIITDVVTTSVSVTTITSTGGS
jgi:hypothetical protein